MNRAMLKKYWSESWLLWTACAIILPIFCRVRIWIVAQFELSKLEPVLEQLRMFEKFSPVPIEQFLTYAGSIAMTYDEPVVIMCILVWSISRGSDVVSGELGRGTMEMLLAQPISRVKVIWTHALITITGLAILAGLTWLGIHWGVQSQTVKEVAPSPTMKLSWLPIEIPLQQQTSETVQVLLADRLDSTLFLPSAINLFAFGFFLLGLSVFFSCIDRYRWRTIGAVLAIYILQFVTFLLGKGTPSTAWALFLTFFSLYRPDEIVRVVNKQPDLAWALVQFDKNGQIVDLGPWGCSLLLIILGSLLYAAGTWYFCRRDLQAPL